MKKHVYSFGNGTADGDGKMKDVLGGKGAGLAEMSRAGVPVPPGFTISTQVCNIYFENHNQVPDEIHKEMLQALEKLQKQMEQVGTKSWSALMAVLTETRTAFDRANQAARDVFKRAA